MAIKDRIAEVHANVNIAKLRSPYPKDPVTLVAVSKTRTVEELNQVLDAGQSILGENRVQELVDKYPMVHAGAQWHLIGHLQTNKVKYITDKVTLIHSLESLELAKEINKRMLEKHGVMSCLVQVNIADEASKFGLAKEEVIPFLRQMESYPGLHIKGLMNIAPYFENPEDVRPTFKAMFQLFEEIKKLQLPNVEMDILSMGMSHDYIVAVEEGANMIRVGSFIFQN